MCLRQLEDGRATVENQYERSVRPGGNAPPRAVLHDVFEVVLRAWRGLRAIESSGLGLRAACAAHGAARKCGVEDPGSRESSECRSGLGDGLFISSAGLALVTRAVDLHPREVRPGDAIVLSGNVGRHGIAVLSTSEPGPVPSVTQGTRRPTRKPPPTGAVMVKEER